ncbi:DNA breaking-rejoining enzyme [Suillus ampliporus]|nr:DNA breaking-rejoining enzyme [Suillus ampliporus]
MLASIETKTHKNYGAGLLRFHQYCDERKIPETHRMPAPEFLLASFISSWAGKVTTSTAQNWLAGIHFWHTLHGAQWNGHSTLKSATSGLAKLVPASSKRPRRPPVTLEHMHALLRNLDLMNTFDVSVFAVATVAFWSCCRLGELVIDSVNSFNPSWHVTRSAPLHCCTTSTSIPFIILSIPWSKTTHGDGDNITISHIDDPSSPVATINHHLAANMSVPENAPFFAFETASGGWSPMCRSWLVNRCNEIWTITGLPTLSGHCFRIGGADLHQTNSATELLLRGTPPDIVAMQGRWKSRAFLDYWRKIDSILPMFISSSLSDSHLALIQSSMDTFSCRYK